MVPVAVKRPVVDDSSEDGDATEFLAARPLSKGPSAPRALPSSSAPSVPSSSPTVEPRGHGRAVPLAALPTAPPSPAAQTPMASSIEAVAVPAPRPLPQRSLPSVTGHTATSSVPRVTRINVNDSISSTGDHDVHGMIRADDHELEPTLPPDEPQQKLLRNPEAARPRRAATAVDIVDDETQAPEEIDPDHTLAPPPSAAPMVAVAPRRLPLTAEGEPSPARAPSPRSAPRPRAPAVPAVAELHDGVLVVEAPVDASITVNGVDRGRGVVRVLDLDRDARHAVRIHAPGFQPWSGSVSLQGKPAAKIRPTLKPRVR